jgi:hypothetical protein
MRNTSPIELEAVEIRLGRYAVRPAGQLGTCGTSPVLWSVVYINASSPAAAIRRTLNPPRGYSLPPYLQTAINQAEGR